LADGAAIYEPSSDGAFRQGEIISSVTILRRREISQSDEITVDLVTHPFAIVVSQDCDLDLDCRARKQISGPDGNVVGPEKMVPNILLCELFTAEELRTSSGINRPIWSRIKDNNDGRYHFFQKVEPDLDAKSEGLSEMVSDFKRYFTVPTEDLYRHLEGVGIYSGFMRRTHLKSPYCEHFSTRFSNYLCRVALPEPHLSVST